MPRQIDNLRSVISRDTDPQSEVDVYVVDSWNDATCKFCRDQGLFNQLCPRCGRWDWRSPFDVEDDLWLADREEA